jgi:hypothetical protein
MDPRNGYMALGWGTAVDLIPERQQQTARTDNLIQHDQLAAVLDRADAELPFIQLGVGDEGGGSCCSEG